MWKRYKYVFFEKEYSRPYINVAMYRLGIGLAMMATYVAFAVFYLTVFRPYFEEDILNFLTRVFYS